LKNIEMGVGAGRQAEIKRVGSEAVVRAACRFWRAEEKRRLKAGRA